MSYIPHPADSAIPLPGSTRSTTPKRQLRPNPKRQRSNLLAADYPPEFEHLLRACTLPGAAALVIQLPTPVLAISLRSRFYSYLRALRIEATRPDLVQLETIATVSAVPGNPCALRFHLVSNSPDLHAVRAALGFPEGAPLPPLPDPDVSHAQVIGIDPNSHFTQGMHKQLQELRAQGKEETAK